MSTPSKRRATHRAATPRTAGDAPAAQPGSASQARAFRPAPVESAPPVPVPRADQIRTAALELFSHKGYAATSIDEVGARVGIKGPSVYKHFRSKQLLLVEIMQGTMHALMESQQAALEAEGEVADQLRRAAEAHVRYHARHALEAFVGNREIHSLDEPHRNEILALRTRYERTLRELIADGVGRGAFRTGSPRLASYAILDMGIGVALWYRPDGPMSEDEVVHAYGEMALRIAGI